MADSDRRLILEVGLEVEQLRRDFEQAKSMTENYADFALKQDNRITQAKADSANKSAAEIRKINQKAKDDLKRQYEEAKKRAKGNSQELLRLKRDYQKNVLKLEEQTNKQIEQSRTKFMRDSEKKLANATILSRRKMKKRIIAELKDRYEKEKRMAKGNAAEVLKIEQRLQRDINQIRSQARGRGGGAGGRAGGGMGAGMSDMGNMLSKIKMGWMAVGVAVAGVAKWVGDAVKEYQKFEKVGIKVKTLLNETQAEALPVAMSQIQKISLKTGEAVDKLGESLYNTISAVPALANNMGAATALVEKASKASVALGTDTNSVVDAMTNLANASGLSLESQEAQTFVLDRMSMALKQGKISGDQMSSSIAKSAPVMRSVTDSSKGTIEAIAAMQAQMTASGISADESSTQIKSLAAEFSDSSKMAKLLQAGLKGVNDEGKVSSWSDVIKSMGQDTKKFTNILGSMEAKNAVLALSKEGGKAFGDLMENMKNAGGTYEKMYNTMSQTSEMAIKRQEAAAQNAKIKVGAVFNEISLGFQSMSTSFWSSVGGLFETSEEKFMTSADNLKKHMGTLSGVRELSAGLNETMSKFGEGGIEGQIALSNGLEDVREKFNSLEGVPEYYRENIESLLGMEETRTADTIDEIIGKIQGFEGVPPEVQQAINDIIDKEGKTPESLAKIQETITNMGGIPEGLATGIDEIVNNQSQTTVDNVNKLAEQMGKLEMISGSQVFVDATESAGLALDAMAEKYDNVYWDIFTQGGAKVWSLESGDLLDNLNVRIDEAKKKEIEMIALINDASTSEADRNGLVDELAKKNIKALEIESQRDQIQNSIREGIQKQVETAKALAHKHQETLDIEKAIMLAKHNAIEKLGAEGETLDYINSVGLEIRENTVASGIAEAEKAGNMELVNELKTNELDHHIELLNTDKDRLEANSELYIGGEDYVATQSDQIDAQIEILETQKEGLTTNEEILDVSDDTLSTVEDTNSALAESSDLKSEQVDLGYEDDDLSQAINDKINDRLGSQSDSIDMQVDRLIELSNETIVQMNLLRTEQERLSTQIEMAKAAGMAVAAMEGAYQQGMAKMSALSGLAQATGKKIMGMQAKQKARKAVGFKPRAKRGGGGSRKKKSDGQKNKEKAAKKAKKAAEKAQKEALKREKKLQKEREKAQKEALKAEEKARKRREKKEEEAFKRELDLLKRKQDKDLEVEKARIEEANRLKAHAKAIKAAEDKIREDLKEFSKNIAEQNKAFVGGSISAIAELLKPFSSEAQKIMEGVNTIITSAAKDTAKKLKDIAGLTTKKTKAETRAQEISFELTVLKADPTNRTISEYAENIAELERSIKDIEAQAKDTKEALKDYNDAYGKWKAERGSLESEINGIKRLAQEEATAAKGSVSTAKSAYNALEFHANSIAGGKFNGGYELLKKVRSELEALGVTYKSTGKGLKKGEFTYKALTVGFKDYEEASNATRLILKELSSTTGKYDSQLLALTNKYDRLLPPKRVLIKSQKEYNAEIYAAQGEIGKYKKSLEGLENTNGDNVTKLKELSTEQRKNNSIVDLSTKKIAKLRGEIEAQKGQKYSSQQAKGMIKQFEGVAFGLTQIGDKYQEVIDIQNEGINNLEKAQFVDKFDKALGVLDNINKDFEMFGINASRLLQKAGQVGSMTDEDIKAILAPLDKDQRDNAEILLRSAMGIFELQFKIKDGIIKQNNLLKDQMIIYRDALVVQAGYSTAISNSMSFIDSYNVKELDYVEKLKKGYEDNLTAINKQLKAVQAGKEAQKEILKESRLQSDELWNQLKQKSALIDLTREEIKKVNESELSDAEKAAKLEALNQQLSVQKNEYELVNTALTGYNTKIKESEKIIEGSTEKSKELNKTQGELTDSFKKSQPIEQRKQDIADLDKMFAEAGDNIIKQAKAIERAMELGETQKGIEATVKVLTQATEQIKKVSDLSIESFKNMDKMIGQFQGGDAVGGLASMANITTQIGQALLGASDPNLKIAGAIILGIGLIMDLTSKIMALFVDKERTSLQKAEAKSNVLKEQVKIYDAQIEKLGVLSDLESTSVDTARERLDYLTKQLAILSTRNKIVSRYLDYDSEQLANRKAALKMTQAELEQRKNVIDEGTEASNLRRGDILENLGFDRFKFGAIVTDDEWGQLTDDINGDLKGVSDDLEAVNIVIDFKKQEIQLMKATFQDEIDKMDVVIEASLNLENIDKALSSTEKKIWKTKKMIMKQMAVLDLDFDLSDLNNIDQIILDLEGVDIPLEFIETLKMLGGFQDDKVGLKISGITDEIDLLNKKVQAGFIEEKDAKIKILALLHKQQRILQRNGGSESEILDVILAIQAVEKEIGEYRDGQTVNSDRLLQHRRAELNLLRETNQITQEIYDERLLALLEDELNVQRLKLNELTEEGATKENILTQTESLWSVEMEIYNLKHKENELDNEQLEKAKALNRERNLMLTSIKQGGGQFTMGDLQELENQVIEQLRAAGASEEQIARQMQTFRATVPTFETGGRTTEGLAKVHDEMIIGVQSTKDTDKMYPGFLDSLNSDPLKAFQDLWMGYQSSIMGKEQARSELNQYYTDIGGINVYNNISSKMDEHQIKKMNNMTIIQMQREFQGKGIQPTQL